MYHGTQLEGKEDYRLVIRRIFLTATSINFGIVSGEVVEVLESFYIDQTQLYTMFDEIFLCWLQRKAQMTY